ACACRPPDNRRRISTCRALYRDTPTLSVMNAPESASGLTMKKFAGSPAAAALARNVALPMKPFCRVVALQPAPLPTGLEVPALRHAKANGFGFRMARNPRLVELVQLLPVYIAGSPAEALFTPLKNARKIGSGDVPAAPVYANVLPLPPAMFACRFAWALRNSSTNPLLKMSNSL